MTPGQMAYFLQCIAGFTGKTMASRRTRTLTEHGYEDGRPSVGKDNLLALLEAGLGSKLADNPNAPDPMYPMHTLAHARRSLFEAYRHHRNKVISDGTLEVVKNRLAARIKELEEKEGRPKNRDIPA